MNRKLLKIVSLILVLVTVSFLWLSCSRSSTTASTQSQVVAVKRGNITTVITGSGNLAFSKTQDLIFQISGLVGEVDVQVGDNVTQGQLLAKLDTTDLEQAVTTADLALKSSQIDLNTAQQAKSNITDQELAVQSAQISLRTAQQAQSSVTSAQTSLETAQNSLAKISYPYTYATFTIDVPAALVAISNAQLNLNQVSANLQPGSAPNYGDALLKFNNAQNSLTQALQQLGHGANLDALVASQNQTARGGTALVTSWATTDYWSLRAAQLAVNSAQASVTNAQNSYQTGLDNANLSLAKAQQALQETKNSYQTGLDKANVNLQTAQNNLVKARSNLAKATISAPFTGIVTAVNISGGQQANQGQIAISIADPNQLEANVLVNEVDIPWVVEGGKVTLAVDAVSALSLPATVTQVAPTATVQSGVVNYTVTIGVQSIVISQPQPGQAGSQNQTGQQPGQAGQRTGQQSAQGRTGGSRGAQTGVPSSVLLRQGLSVTASITKQQRTNVLLVPASAVTQQGTNSYVTVVKSDGTTELRQVQTGLTDGVNTEITQGVSEGENVLVTPRTATTATTPAGQFRPGGGIRIGG